MNPLLEQFLSEGRDFLQGIGEKLMALEKAPDDASLMTELFRLVHTLKGNSGLFDFPAMTLVLHAAEDLMDDVRSSKVSYSQTLADRLLDAMDFVSMQCDEIEASEGIASPHSDHARQLAESLRALRGQGTATVQAPESAVSVSAGADMSAWDRIPTDQHALLEDALRSGMSVYLIEYLPDDNCFFSGEDPLFQAIQTPGVIWRTAFARHPWPELAKMDAYACNLGFLMASTAARADLDEHYRYMPDTVKMIALQARASVSQATAVVTLDAVREQALRQILDVQARILALPVLNESHLGRLRAVSNTLAGCLRASGREGELGALMAATQRAIDETSGDVLLTGMHRLFADLLPDIVPIAQSTLDAAPDADQEVRFGRRAEDSSGASRSLKVDQVKVDRLMNLIGEIVVAKNALPYLAARAENQFGVRELAREIKSQYQVINRIAEEMQDAIMQVRMMPVSFIFQRFPRLVRDISRKLGKDVHLVLEGEETEADKNIIESLGDPLVHIVRNSLDHGFELPDVRKAAGKPAAGTLTIRARQESDRAVIEIIDDGKGIDPEVVKRKALEKGLIDEAALTRLSDQEAVNLVFAPGFSTAEAISDLSGRGVGMDVVRAAIERVNGAVALESVKGQGTRIRLSLPLSMAVTTVMIVESDNQLFGVPMECVVETVRVPSADIRTIKKSMTTVLRGRIVPLRSINRLLGLDAPPLTNEQDEYAVLIVRLGDEILGLLVDDFRETMGIILKPLSGVLAGLAGYSGSALMGDGTVLMVLNAKELI
ncbi:chemotaxis protein CheA [Burkholderiaceae bacterium DAT-1]|nr:chemotaxis protein CheA [Burkholderiaceae bacterium DAT-1]